MANSDGSLSWEGGVNSLKPTTVQSATTPNGLPRNQLSWLVNGTVRGGGIQQRFGWEYLCKFTDIGLFQGGFIYEPLGEDPYLVVSIGGIIYKVLIGSNNAIVKLTTPGLENPPLQPKSYFVQAERFLIIQAGDNITNPLFWDGTTLRRSLGPSITVGTVAINFVVPAVGVIVLATLSATYVDTGAQIVLIGGKQYQIAPSTFPHQFVTLKNIYDDPAITPAHGSGQIVKRLPDYVAHVQTIASANVNEADVVLTAPFTFPPGPDAFTRLSVYINGVKCFIVSQSDTTHIRVGSALGASFAQLMASPVGAGITYLTPTTDIATLYTGFFTPGIGSVVDTSFFSSYAGPTNQPILIESGFYEIQALGQPFIPSNQVYLTNLNDTPGNTVTAGTVITTPYELPPATCMVYYMNRVWYAQGRTYIAGDISKGPSGTSPYNFTDAVLKVTENPLAVGGDGFTVPSDAGNVRCLTYTNELDTALGQGLLYIGTSRSFYRLTVPVSRTAWIAANDASQPLQTVAQIKYGPVNDRSVVRVNGDILYQTIEPAIRSLTLARRNFGQWANPPISRNEERVLAFNDRALMQFCSGIEFDNRMLQTTLPIQTPVGVASQGIIPLDFDLISTLEQQLPPAWEGMYEGLNHLQLFEGDFGGRQRAFSVVYSSEDASIQVWELSDNLRNDINQFGESRTKMVIEFPAYTDGVELLLKRLTGGEIWVDRIAGKVDFLLEYRPDGDACWHFWTYWQTCSSRNSCEDLVNPVCYPITPYAEGYKQTWSLPKPPERDCVSMAGRPAWIGHQFQCRLTITGWVRVRGFVLTMEKVDQKQYHDNACLTPLPAFQPPLAPQVNTPEEPTPQIPFIGHDNGFDPILGPPFPPVIYQLFAYNTSSPRLTWTVPDVFITGSGNVGGTVIAGYTITLTIMNYDSVPPGTVVNMDQWFPTLVGGEVVTNAVFRGNSPGPGGAGFGFTWTFTDGPPNPVFTFTVPAFVGPPDPSGQPLTVYFVVTATASGHTVSSNPIAVVIPYI